ncbi:MAG: hydrogenase maturation nickel metallochaperone HypA [Nitrospirota bacterium]
MHEMSITMGMLDIVKEQMAKHGVTKLMKVRIKVGEMTAVEPESLRFCFEACTKDTPIEGAVLEIEEVPLTGRCRECGDVFHLEGYCARCPVCQSASVDHISGHELNIVSMEVE